MANIGSATFQGCDALESIVIGIGVKTVAGSAFAECVAFKTVFYRGTVSDRENINIEAESNKALMDATWYYYSETKPTVQGNYWHYVDGVPTVW
jgi:hypothetical protein